MTLIVPQILCKFIAKKMSGRLYLIPNSLGNPDPDTYLSPQIQVLIARLRFFVVENTRNARRYLKSVNREVIIDDLTFYELNKHTEPGEIITFLRPLIEGHDIGVISEAGLPGIADPGAVLVQKAHQQNIPVIPLAGPSSIFMALMASGLNGQSFRFVGYLPVQRGERMSAVKNLERIVDETGETQIFIETPYRNDSLLGDICATCREQTMLTIAADITTETELIKTATVGYWKKKKPDLHKRPAVFLLGRL
jgi:16S rRNA (cytidine1402-2'-O)-methyltransferase